MTALVLVIAMIVAGECGPIGGGCEVAVCRTMANRLVVQDTDLAAVLAAYHGRARPTAASVAAAAALARCPSCLADGAYYYVYSNEDRAIMDWPAGDVVLCRHNFCVHLRHDYPGGGSR